MLHQRILKEIELYLKSYEVENEDSDWDSDDECEAIVLCQDLKNVINEKAKLTNEISAVEMELITQHSNISNDKLDSTQTNTENVSFVLNKTGSSDENTKNVAVNQTLSPIPTKGKSLYKNVL